MFTFVVFRREPLRGFAKVAFALLLFLALMAFPAAAEDFTATTIGDFGNVTVMEAVGNLDADLPDGTFNALPRQVIAREFLRTHKDEYDFLVIFSNFDYDLGKAEAANARVNGFYHPVKNDVQGIGEEIFDNSSLYGSAGRLQGTIDMGNLADQVSDPLDGDFDVTLSTLVHEVLHRWAAHVRFKDDSGNLSGALLGESGSHWSYLLDSDGSVEYGSRWRDNGDGTFTALETRTYYSPLDLYLMGMIGKEEVPPMLLIENPEIDPAKLPEPGATISGTATTVTIDDIIDAEGPRIPAADQSQKSFRTAFVYLTAPGTFDRIGLSKLETVRNAFLTRFSILTDGEALVQVASEPLEALPVNPGVTDPVKEVRNVPPSIDEGVTWLKGRQQTDGTWSDSPQTASRDTAEATTALHLFAGNEAEVDKASGWLANGTEVSTDYLARRVESLARAGRDTSALVPELLDRQNPDGGWGGGRNYVSNPTDTALALKALAETGFVGRWVLDPAVEYLKTGQNADGGWSGQGTTSLIQTTANTLLAFNAYAGIYDFTEPGAKAVAFLQARQNPDGGFGNSPSTVYDSAAAVLALTASGSAKESASRGVGYLLAEQSADGSWYRSPYQTAVAVQAVHAATVEPDLQITADNLSFIPATITALPTNAVLSAEIENLGRTDVPQCRVTLYDGLDTDAEPIAEQSLAFPAGASVVATFSVLVADGEQHLFTVVADPAGAVDEQNEGNNRAVAVLKAEPTTDLEIAPGDLTVSPNPADIFGDVTIGATIHNCGTADAFDVPVRLSVEAGDLTIDIATRSVDVPANGSVSVEAVWRASLAGTDLVVVAEADPAGAIAESDESNNRTTVPLTVNGATLPNLGISYEDLTFDPATAREGGSVTIGAEVKNSGFSTAQNIQVDFYKGVPEKGGLLLGSRVVPSLAPGERSLVNIRWENIAESGGRVVYVIVDGENTIEEIAENDNEAFTSLQILSLPDLDISASSVVVTPATPREGEAVTVSVTVQNRGEQVAQSVAVQLLEGGSVVTSGIIPSILGNSQETVLFDYGTAGQTGSHDLSVMVDPGNSIAEQSEENNEAVRSFGVQDADLWVSERYISPNGDGVQDSTRFTFRLDAPASVTVEVVGEDGAVVRSFAGPEFENTDGGSVLWDGLSDKGTVVDDGAYRMQIRTAIGAVLKNVPIVVDNNRSPFAKAMGSAHLLSQRFDSWKSFRDVTWLPEESGILMRRNYTDCGNDPNCIGVYLAPLTDEEPKKMTPSEWVAPPYTGAGWSSDLGYSLSPDGKHLLMTFNAKDGIYTVLDHDFGQLWVMNLETEERRLLGESKVNSLWYGNPYSTGDIGQSAWAPDGNNVAYFAMKTAPTSWPKNIDYVLRIVGLDGEEKGEIGGFSDTNAAYRPLEWSPDGEKVACQNRNGDLVVLDIHGNVSTFRVSSWIYKWLDNERIIVGKDILRASTGVIQSLLVEEGDASYLSPDRKRLVVYDQAHGTDTKSYFYLYDLEKESLLLKAETAMEWLDSDYPDFGDDGRYWSKNGKLYLVGSYEPSAYTESLILAVFDLKSPEVKQTTIRGVDDGCWSYRLEGSTWIDEGEIILGNIFNARCFENDYWPILFDTRSSDITEVRPFEDYADDFTMSPSARYLSFFDGGVFTAQSSLQNLAVHLDPSRSHSEISVKGTATDLNFAGYKLEYADAVNPDLWTLIQPPSGYPVVDDTLANWVPPHEGSFHVRLTAWDKAGNVQWDRKRVTWGLSSSIANLYKSAEVFSPNGDGTKDTVELHYRALEPVHLQFFVFDRDNRLVRSFFKDHATPGDFSVLWDGKDESGQTVPDGTYKISVLDYEFFVDVDNTPPDVGVLLGALDPELMFVDLSGHAVDKNMNFWRMDFGSGDAAQQWNELKSGGELLAVRDESREPLISPIKDALVKRISAADLGQFAGSRFRLVAEDKAGNIASALSSRLDETIVLVSWDYKVITGTIPSSLAHAGVHRITGAETFSLLLEHLSLQYRIGRIWFDATADITVENGLITVQWDNSAVVPDFNAIRLRGVDAIGQEHFSNALLAFNIFNITTNCSGAMWGHNDLIEKLSELKFQFRSEGEEEWGDYYTANGNVGHEIPTGNFIVVPPSLLDTGGKGVDAIRMVATGVSGHQYASAVAPPTPLCPDPPELKLEATYGQAECGEIAGRAQISAQVEGGIVAADSLETYVTRDGQRQLVQERKAALSSSTSVDTWSWPEGSYPVEAVLHYTDLSTAESGEISKTTSLLVDRTLPTAQITFPVHASTTLCPVEVNDATGRWYGVPVEGLALDNKAVARYELYYGIGENPSLWLPATAPKLNDKGQKVNKQIVGKGAIKGRVGVWNISGLHGDIYSLKLKVIDRAGNVTCFSTSFMVDSVVEISTLSVDKNLFSPNSDGFEDEVRVSYSVGEPATVDVEVYPLVKTGASTFELAPTPIRKLVAGLSYLEGQEQATWDGADDSGATVSDGRYGIAVKANDSCGHTVSRWVAVKVDRTAPSTAIGYPEPSDPLGTVVEVRGTVDDPNFSRYVLEVGQEGDPDSWRTLSSKNIPVANGILGMWNTYGIEGTWTLHLEAVDRAENRSEARVTVDLGQRKNLIKNLTAEPNLFSPNDDGKLESTDIVYELNEPCRIDLEIADASSGVVVRTYSVEIASAGSYHYLWRGESQDGQKVPDGDYKINFRAELTANPSVWQSETVTVAVDGTAPQVAVNGLEEGSYLNLKELTINGSILDPHLQDYTVVYSGPDGGEGIDSGNQSRKDHSFGVLNDLSEGKYVLAIEGRDLGENGVRVERTFSIDRTPPVARMKLSSESHYFGGQNAVVGMVGEILEANPESVTLRYGRGSDPKEWIELQGGGGLSGDALSYAWNIGPETGVVDGVYSFSLLARDKAGLEGEARVSVTVDNTAPAVAVMTPAGGSFVTAPMAVRGTARDPNLVETVLELSEGTCSEAYKWVPLTTLQGSVEDGQLFDWDHLPADGNYCFRLESLDQVGNHGETLIDFTVDTHPPAAPVLSGNLEKNADMMVKWTGGEEADLAGYNLYRNGRKLNGVPLAESSYLDFALEEGDSSYVLRAVDRAGNESEPSNTLTVRVDRTPPKVEIGSPQPGELVSNYLDIMGTAFSEDDFKEYRIYVGQGAHPTSWDLFRKSPVPVNAGSLARWDLLEVAEGDYTLRLEAEDLSGNRSVLETAVEVDNTPPQAPELLSASVNGADIVLNWKANSESDLAGYLLYRNGQIVNASEIGMGDLSRYLIVETGYTDTAVPDGTFEYAVVAVDRAGNLSESSNSLEVILDLHPPKATIVEPTAALEFEKPILVRAESADKDIASIRLQFQSPSGSWLDLFDSLSSGVCGAYLDPERLGLKYGEYRLRAVATDEGGKTDPAPSTVAVTYMDLTPPSSPTGLSGHAEGDKAVLSWDANVENDLVGYRVYMVMESQSEPCGNDLTSTSKFVEEGLSDGTYLFEVSAVDAFGNESRPSNTISVKIYTPQLLQPITPTKENMVTIEGSGSEPGSIVEIVAESEGEIFSRTKAVADLGGNFIFEGLSLRLGENRFRAVAKVPDGNVSRSSAVVSVFYNEPPDPPSGLEASVEGFAVQLAWDQNRESDLMGYNIYRDGSKLNTPVPVAGITPSASSTYHRYYSPSSVLDQNPNSYWLSGVNYNQVPVWFEVSLPGPQLISHLGIDWGSSFFNIGRSFEIQGWTGSSWFPLAQMKGNESSSNAFDFEPSFRTDKIRILVTEFGDYRNQIQIAELTLVREKLLTVTTFLDDKDLVDGRFDYQVSAVNQSGFESQRSGEVSAFVGDVLPPDAPMGLTATANASDILLDWSLTPNSETDLAGYHVYRQMGSNWIRLNELPLAENCFSDGGLVNGTYVYRITAVDKVGNESVPSQAVSVEVGIDSPESPQALGVLSPPEGGSLSVEWAAGVEKTEAFNLYRRFTSGTSYRRINISAVRETTYRETGLQNGEEYCYVVTAVDSIGNESAFSSEICGAPEDRLAPPAPDISFPTMPAFPKMADEKEIGVGGMAEPGALVEVYRNGVSAGITQAQTATETHAEPLGLIGFYLTVSPDGAAMAYRDLDGALWIEKRLTGEKKMIASKGDFPRWSPDGKKIAYQAGGRIRLYDLELQNSILLTDSPDGNECDPTWSSDSDNVIFLRGKNLWMKSLASGMLFQLTSGYQVSISRLSPDGRRLAFISSYSVFVLNLDDGSVLKVGQKASRSALGWSPDGSLAFIGTREGFENIFTFDPLTQALDQITHSSTSTAIKSFSWSPNGKYFAYETRGSDGYSAVWITTLGGESSLLQERVKQLSGLAWLPAAEIVFVENAGVLHSGHTSGYFFLEDVPIRAGENVFYAIASDASGNQSISSETISVIYDTNQLPDLSVSERDISIYPLYPKMGEKVAIGATVHNDSQSIAHDVNAALYLWDVSGNLTLLNSMTIPSIAGGESITIAAETTAESQLGTNSVIVILDPSDGIVEKIENNNSATKEYQLTDQEGLFVETVLSKNHYNSDNWVDCDVRLSNSGRPADVVLEVAIEDAKGNVLFPFEPQAATLAYGNEVFPFRWNTKNTFAGAYGVHVRLRNTTGTLVEKYAPFDILPDINVETTLATDKSVYEAFEDVQLTTQLRNLGLNNALQGVKVGINIVDGQSTELYGEEKEMNSLLPGMSGAFVSEWNTGRTDPGEYLVKVVASLNGQVLKATSTHLTIKPVVAVQGALAIHPEEVLTGNDFGANYRLRNVGNAEASGVIVATLIDPEKQKVVATKERAVTLPVSDVQGGAFTFGTDGLRLQPYRVVLRFVSQGKEQSLAEARMSPKDGLPPRIKVVSPGSDLVYDSAVPLSAEAIDDATGVGKVEFRIDGEVWQPLFASALNAGRYTAFWEPSLQSEEDHVVWFRAFDLAGNVTTTQPVAFKVQMDRDPPVTEIRIEGPHYIASQGLISHVSASSVFAMSVTDDFSGVERTEFRIDGGDWMAYAPFTLAGLAEGEHLIGYRSADNVGNVETEQVIKVVVDNTAPETAISVGDPKFSGDALYVTGITEFILSPSDTLSDITRTEYRIDGGDWRPYAPFTLTNLPDGAHTIEFHAVDNVDNVEAEKSLAVILDNTPPVTAIRFDHQSYLDGEDLLISRQTEISLSASDELSGVSVIQYRFDDDAGWNTCYGIFRLPDIPYGTHILRYRSIDNVGNKEVEKVVTLTLIGVEFETEVLNLPRVLVWTEDPARQKGKNRPSWTLDEARSLVGEAMGGSDTYTTVTADKDEFQGLLRSGIYNMAMILNQDVPFDTVFLREMREAVNRGTGLFVSSWGSSVPPLWQEIFGVDFKGSVSMDEEERPLHLFDSPVSPEQSLTASGRVLRTTLDGGTLAGILPAESTCKGLRGLSLRYPLDMAEGDRVTVSLALPRGKKTITVDEEELTVSGLPEEAINGFTGNTAGDLAIGSITDDGITLTLAAPYGYLEESYTLSLTVDRADGTTVVTGPVAVAPVCDANLQAGMSVGPFEVLSAYEDRVKAGDDLPAVVLAEYGKGRTAFLSYNLIESVLNEERSEHLGLLRRTASWLLPETAHPKAGGVALLETRIKLLGTGLDLQAVDTLGEGITHLPLFDLTKSPLTYSFHLEDGEQASYRYFARFADHQGNYAKSTAVLLDLEGGYVPFADYSAGFSVEEDSFSLLLQALAWVDRQRQAHPEAGDALEAIRDELEMIGTLPRTTPKEVERILHQTVQSIHHALQLGIDTDGLRTLLDDYLRIAEGVGDLN